ncbi:metallophosphoesterase [Frisingicoccus sp.]|uniref:metallophosphoesterase n=1 Tax=Frisingicoccus sp. TaxID=1918627 RepID=UPI003AB6173A
MYYVMSDIHGCYREYRKALKMIHFGEEDTLYVLGDVVDRGPEPIRVLQDMMLRRNVFPIIGNHEYMALMVLKKFAAEITEANTENYLSADDITSYMNWSLNGGQTTVEEFRKLSSDERQDIMDYLEEFTLYEEVQTGGKNYVLVHGSFEPFVPGKPLDAYDLSEVIFKSPDYNKVYFGDCYLVTGHRPTLWLEGAQRGRIFEKNHHIAVDCGCVFGGRLGVYCLDNGKTWYVEREEYEV